MPDFRVTSRPHLILIINLQDTISPSFTEAESWIKKFAQSHPAICLPLGFMILQKKRHRHRYFFSHAFMHCVYTQWA